MTDLLNFINMHANAVRNGTLTIKMDDDFIVVSTVNGYANVEDSYCKLDSYFNRVSHEFDLVIPYGNLNKEGKSSTTVDDLIVLKTVKDFPPIYLQRTYELELGLRSANCLRAEQLFYIGDLIQKSEKELLIIPNFGLKSLREVKESLDDLGLHLGMVNKSWPPIDLGKQDD